MSAMLISIMLSAVAISSCGRKESQTAGANEIYKPEYAGGFEIVCGDDSVATLIIKNPWQGADSVTMSYRVEKPAERIVAMSSTFTAMLEGLGATDRIVGVSGLGFISSDALRSRGDKVADVGYDSNIDFEKIVMLNPDVVLLYGVNGPNVIEAKLKELGIPYVYIGDYLEESPLGKTEWVAAIGEIIGKREEAIALFDSIAGRYNALKSHYSSIADKPGVMVNAPYGDSGGCRQRAITCHSLSPMPAEITSIRRIPATGQRTLTSRRLTCLRLKPMCGLIRGRPHQRHSSQLWRRGLPTRSLLSMAVSITITAAVRRGAEMISMSRGSCIPMLCFKT